MLPMLPRELVSTAAWIAVISCAVVGLVLWATGARFGRSWITLVMVGGGALVGKMLPKWCGWIIDPMAPAIARALIFALLGYLIYRLWIGIGTGVIMGLWVALGFWLAMSPVRGWEWPDVDRNQPVAQYGMEVWRQMPAGYTEWVPYWAGVALLCGAAGTVLWPRIGTVLLYSMTGLSLLLGSALIAINVKHPDWLEFMPSGWMQCTILGLLVAAGALLQDRLAVARNEHLAATRIDRERKEAEKQRAKDEE
jgi:hypothetical protein